MSVTDNAPLPRIDRAAHLRKDTDRLLLALDCADTLLVPVWRDQQLVTAGGAPRAVLPSVAAARQLVDAAEEIVWLGRIREQDCFALDLSPLTDPLAHQTLTGHAELADLRHAGGLLPPFEAELLAYARGILHWHRHCRFCGSCGRPTRAREGGHMRECPDEALKYFPRTDPAVMVLVTAEDRCVLARQPGWPSGMYAVIAGFVEPGESVEDAARREVREELGIEVTDLSYLRSQPWPFPASLMLGYQARALSETLTLDGEELEDARWFTRDELDNPTGFFFPPAYSLAHYLIRAFMHAR